MLKQSIPRSLIQIFLGTTCLISFNGCSTDNSSYIAPNDSSNTQHLNDSADPKSPNYSEGKEEVADTSPQKVSYSDNQRTNQTSSSPRISYSDNQKTPQVSSYPQNASYSNNQRTNQASNNTRPVSYSSNQKPTQTYSYPQKVSYSTNQKTNQASYYNQSATYPYNQKTPQAYSYPQKGSYSSNQKTYQPSSYPNKQVQQQPHTYQTKEIAQSAFDPPYEDPYRVRAWNWDYKENWREDKDVFYRGGTQTAAMQRDFRYVRPPGIGDPDDVYWLYHRGFYARPFFDEAYNTPPSGIDNNRYQYNQRYYRRY
jgi:hypothetical protein